MGRSIHTQLIQSSKMTPYTTQGRTRWEISAGSWWNFEWSGPWLELSSEMASSPWPTPGYRSLNRRPGVAIHIAIASLPMASPPLIPRVILAAFACSKKFGRAETMECSAKLNTIQRTQMGCDHSTQINRRWENLTESSEQQHRICSCEVHNRLCEIFTPISSVA